MTREKRELAIEELQGCIIAEEHGKDGKPNGNVTCELTKDTINLAIKALEQEPILDKIKEDFIARYPRNYAGELELGGRSCVFSLNNILNIIDKYKTGK